MAAYNFRFYHSLLIFLGSILWVIAVVGAMEYFDWYAQFVPGLLIHTGIIIICIAGTMTIIHSIEFSSFLATINFNKSSFGYYLIALVFAVTVWLADYWLQLFYFLNDGKSDGLEIQSDIAKFGLFSMVLASCFLGPIAEEILFRGTLLKGLLEKFNPTSSIIISSILFAAIHFSSNDFLILFVAAVGYAILTLKAKSILPALLAHIINNSVTVYYLLTL